MTVQLNEFQQPIGKSLTGWTPAQHPEQSLHTGRFCRLERLNAELHVEELYEAFQESPDARYWTYLPYGR